MFIKSIVLDGFKSYAQRTEITGFDPLFNAITGLNGSGKSNILDSICFVLGISNLHHVSHSLTLSSFSIRLMSFILWYKAAGYASHWTNLANKVFTITISDSLIQSSLTSKSNSISQWSITQWMNWNWIESNDSINQFKLSMISWFSLQAFNFTYDFKFKV